MSRILLVTHYYPDHRSGIELVAGNVARRLASRGWEVTWAASAVTPGVGTDGVSLLPMPAWNWTEDRLGVPYPLWSPGSLDRLAAAVRGADVVHLHDALYFGNAVAYRLARRYGKPVVVTQHIGDVPYKSRLLHGMLWTANRTVARHVLGGADQVVFYATRVRDYFGRFVHFRTAPQFIPNGVDTALFRPPADATERAAARAALGWPADRPVLLFVGRFVEKKGLHVLRGAAERLPDCDFVFAGWGPIDPSSWGRPNVRLAGSLPSEQLAELFRAADLLVLPSVGEGFPLVVQEAMACGTPAIISRETAAGYPGAPDWAIAVEPTPDAVVTAVRATLADAYGIARRRIAVAAVARAQWDWDRCAAAYSDMFRNLTGGCRDNSRPPSPSVSGLWGLPNLQSPARLNGSTPFTGSRGTGPSADRRGGSTTPPGYD